MVGVSGAFLGGVAGSGEKGEGCKAKD